MNKVTFFLLAVLFSGHLGAAPVWQVTQGNNTFYLGGTIHVLSQEDYPLPASFELAYGASEMLFFETDVCSERCCGATEFATAGEFAGRGNLARLFGPRSISSAGKLVAPNAVTEPSI